MYLVELLNVYDYFYICRFVREVTFSNHIATKLRNTISPAIFYGIESNVYWRNGSFNTLTFDKVFAGFHC